MARPDKPGAGRILQPDAGGIHLPRARGGSRDLNYSEIASLELTLLPLWHQIGWVRGTLAGGGVVLLATLLVLGFTVIKHRKQISSYQRHAVQELQDAQRVQMSLMPESAPEIEGLEIFGKCVPANTVSGDFFDYLWESAPLRIGMQTPALDNRGQETAPTEIGLVIADVTGKLMKGAMNAVMTDGILHSVVKEQEKLSPAALLMKLNDVLKERTEREMNVTMVIGLINVETKILTLSNAAHHAYPLLVRDRKVETLKLGGMPLGMMAGIPYREKQFPLQSGDVLVLMTDGIIEAMDGQGRYYGDTNRLEGVLSQFIPKMSAEAMVDAVIADAIDHGGGNREDDMTVVVAKVL